MKELPRAQTSAFEANIIICSMMMMSMSSCVTRE